MLDKDIKHLLSNSKNVALIGISLDSKKPSNFVMKYLLDNGYNVYPINPIHEGKKVHNQIILKNLDQLNSEIDILNIFRPSAECGTIVKESLKKNPKNIWLQLGIQNQEARDLSTQQKIPYIENKCILVEHRRLIDV